MTNMCVPVSALLAFLPVPCLTLPPRAAGLLAEGRDGISEPKQRGHLLDLLERLHQVLVLVACINAQVDDRLISRPRTAGVTSDVFRTVGTPSHLIYSWIIMTKAVV